jgi:dynein heavy chain
LIKLELHKFSEDVTELVDGAQKEAKIETKLNMISTYWETQAFDFKDYKDVPILDALDETVEAGEQHAMELLGMLSSKDVEEFKEKVLQWQKTLKTVDSVISIWVKVQRSWQRLEPIFLASADIRAQLPDDTRKFESVDTAFKEMMREAREEPGVVTACTWEGREEALENFAAEIEQCQKALADYLAQKRRIFARFYFVSEQALLDILSNGTNPEKVDEYLGDCFDGLKSLEFVRGPGQPVPAKSACGMCSKEREEVKFSEYFTCNGAVESYLCDLERFIQKQLADILEHASETAMQWGIDAESDRHLWLEAYPAQIALLATQIIWTDETARAFDELEGGRETAMSQHLDQVKTRIERLIERVRSKLPADLRVKIITIITIDVHSRDTIRDFVVRKIVDQQLFAWQSQLKFYLEKREKGGKPVEGKICVAKICDWQTFYNYEYVGNCGRLVITPLTDRCYITLTQALNLTMGGAPAGPAGTGKTETTKDLGRALGLQVVVFNCSDQMTYITMASIFMGLSQTGSWGCFDEFNRISIDVLSVVSTQVKDVLDALRIMKKNPAKNTFFFQEEEIDLRLTVGFFITMNPGYAGRTELPENLKALFRSCAMVVPDITRICENMLMAEGFSTAEDLSKKFMTLYQLAKSLLSKQIHYDWGLRAVKSVLRQAGALKRAPANLGVSEDLLLRRGLRDFNWPKIVVDDREIFKGLIRDLFPGIQEEETQMDEDLVGRIRAEAKHRGLQAEDGSDFTLKALQLSEILEVRHSCFIIGNPGSGKTVVWKTLAGAMTRGGEECIYENADPKAVTSDELFGCMNPKTKEWKDGVLSTIMRDMNKNQGRYKPEHKAKWIILDGDVDPEWIESLNTVMDDNKVLTLVSQERIPLTPEMRLILEVSNLKNATPATVSRGGVLFINDTDVGWRPYFDSWLVKYKKSDDEYAENVFTLALSNYISDAFLEDLRGRGHIAPVCDMSRVQSMTCILDHLYNTLHKVKAQYDVLKRLREEGKEDEIKTLYEAFFIFAAMWAYGGSLDQDDKNSFSKNLIASSKVKFPEGGQCFDYFYDPLEMGWKPWASRVSVMEEHYDGLFQNLVVPTAETTRQQFLLDVHNRARKGLLYVGSAGTGKTTIVQNYFGTLDTDRTVTASINFNSYTDSKALQVVVMSQVDKRAGRTYGPPPSKTLIYFMDDLNMPYVDKYGTQSPICLVRQILDHGIVYDRDHLEEQKQLVDVMFHACMNPKSGSFFVDLRLSRHFTLVSCLTAEREILKTIYDQILGAHLSTFDKSISDLTTRLVSATTTVFWGVATSPQFMPTARKFHYQFNLRDFSKIIQNLMLAQPAAYRSKPMDMIRMWAHECHRVWLDRLIFDADRELYMNLMRAGLKEFADVKEEAVFETPLLYTSYVAACETGEPNYLPVTDMLKLKTVLEAKLEEYNEQVASMNLVLFDQAMEHVSRIARIIDLPVGSALLVGVGGSGKQSLAKLSAFILNYDVVRIVVTSNYGLVDLSTDIQSFFVKAGVQGAQLLFLLTDGQVTQDRFLVPINDLLAAGWIPELFPPDELDTVRSKVRSEAKQQGFLDTPDQLEAFFRDKVRKNLHLGLCFSPVGDAFRFRARMFPGLINCTSLDWFHPWPRDALIDVAYRFLSEVELPGEGDELCQAISQHMAMVHLSIEEANEEFRAAERRNNYTTPTSFLELITFYKLLLNRKRGHITEQIERLEVGLQTMKGTTEQVSELTHLLEVKMVDVKQEREKTDELIAIVGRESLEAEKEAAAAASQKAEANRATQEANEEKAKAVSELDEAVPAMEAAQEAVNCLKVDAVQELKGMGSPPADCVNVARAVLILVRSEKRNHAWPNAQKMMNNPNKFLQEVKDFNGESIEEWKLKALQDQLNDPNFNQNYMKSKSTAASYLCAWVVNIAKFNQIYLKVKPLQEAALSAQ